MQLTIIGASGSFPGPGSPASCYLVSANGVDEHGQPKTWRIILDMGNGALGTLQRYLALEDIDAIMLSHLHPDHFMVFFSSRRRHTRSKRDWSSDVCSSDLPYAVMRRAGLTPETIQNMYHPQGTVGIN